MITKNRGKDLIKMKIWELLCELNAVEKDSSLVIAYECSDDKLREVGTVANVRECKSGKIAVCIDESGREVTTENLINMIYEEWGSLDAIIAKETEDGNVEEYGNITKVCDCSEFRRVYAICYDKYAIVNSVIQDAIARSGATNTGNENRPGGGEPFGELSQEPGKKLKKTEREHGK